MSSRINMKSGGDHIVALEFMTPDDTLMVISSASLIGVGSLTSTEIADRATLFVGTNGIVQVMIDGKTAPFLPKGTYQMRIQAINDSNFAEIVEITIYAD